MSSPKESSKPKNPDAAKPQQNAPAASAQSVPNPNIPQQQYPRPGQYPPPYAAMPGYPPYGMPYPINYAPPKPKPVFTRTDSIFAMLSFVVGFLIMRYMIWYQNGYFTTATAVIMLGFIIWYLVKRGFKLVLHNYINLGIIVLLSTLFSFTSDHAIKGWTVTAILGLSAYLVYSVCSGRRFSEFFFKDQTNSVIFPFNGFGFNFSALGKGKDGSKKGRVGNVLIGLAVSLPLFFIVLVILVSADRAMENIVFDFIDILAEDILLVIPQFILGIPIAMYVFGMMYVGASRRMQEKTTDEAYKKSRESGRVLPKSAVFAALAPILLLYIIFFFSQLPYFLSGFSGKLPNELTYADFARNGFFQLLFLTALNLVLIICMQRYSRDSADHKSVSLRIFSILFSLSTLVLVAVALSKMIMYIQSYGLTRLRVHTTWMIVLIALVFILIIIKQMYNRFPLIRSIVVATLLMFSVLAFGRINYQIAKFNITMYKEGSHKELDFNYLIYDLGDESLLYILEHDEMDTLQAALDKQGKGWSSYDGYYYDYYYYYDQDYQILSIKGRISDKLLYRSRYSFYNYSSARLKRLAGIKLGIVFD